MYFENKKAKDVKIAYIGGGSRGWAWLLMNDLAQVEDMSGEICLYDIDKDAARNNAIIGSKFPGDWTYKACDDVADALTDANFVIISILPGTFDEMEVDVHAPEKYGIYQSVGDTAGPGGFMRSLRTVPMMREIAQNVRKYCPKAYVINFTNPMSVCIGALYREFPEIRAHGCCHEVFGTKKLFASVLREIEGIEGVTRNEISANVVGVNHFTWITKASYQGRDIFPIYDKFIEKYYESGYSDEGLGNWLNDFFAFGERVKMDLYKKYGCAAAAGDRHLAEFMDFEDYLYDCKEWAFNLTPVSWRKENLKNRLERAQRLVSGEETYELKDSGEESTLQMRALLGLEDFVTNVNLPNVGQIPNLPIGTIVETNASFSSDSVQPVMAGPIPDSVYPLISRAAKEIEMMLDAAFSLDKAYAKELFTKLNFIKGLKLCEREELFETMFEGTKKYLTQYK
jgi:alpha-galactosidase